MKLFTFSCTEEVQLKEGWGKLIAFVFFFEDVQSSEDICWENISGTGVREQSFQEGVFGRGISENEWRQGHGRIGEQEDYGGNSRFNWDPVIQLWWCAAKVLHG